MNSLIKLHTRRKFRTRPIKVVNGISGIDIPFTEIQTTKEQLDFLAVTFNKRFKTMSMNSFSIKK